MQEDPVFKRMVQKSFILQKQQNLEIPLVKKTPTIKNHIMTTFTIASGIHFLIYPLDTIKTRIIARATNYDIAKFSQNRVAKLTAYLGLFRGYASIIISNACHLTIGKQTIIGACVAESLLKTWVDMSKISKQMGNKKGDFQIMKRCLPICTIYAMIRDLLYRGIYIELMRRQQIEQRNRKRVYNQTIRMNYMFGAGIIATLISHPFDVCFVKMASQRQLKYIGFLQTPRSIFKQESIGKLMLSGFWARMSYNLIAMLILNNAYDKLLNVTLQIIE